MPRIRTIKPEFWDSPSTAKASPWARLLYIAMWNWADDYGRGTANLKELEGFAFPNDDKFTDCSGNTVHFRDLVAEVSECFGVVFYTVGERHFYEIQGWNKHQRNERRAKQSRFPSPQVSEAVAEIPCKRTEAPRSSGPGTGEQGNRGTGEQILTSHVASDDDDDVAPVEAEIIERPEIEDLLDQLEHRIRANGNRPGNRTKTAHDAIRRMIDIDGYTVEQISFIIDWSQASEFWQANILSAKKLRDKMPTLVAQARRDHQNPTREQQAQRDLADDNDYMPEWAKQRTS